MDQPCPRNSLTIAARFCGSSVVTAKRAPLSTKHAISGSVNSARRAWLAYALTGIGATYVAEGNPDNALVPLERALKIRNYRTRSLRAAPRRNFVLAQALWDSNRDRGRALALAEEAKAAYAKT